MADIICIVGPTASGKTRLSIELAKAVNGEIVSCDSMQFYRCMDIGTAKPTPEEQAAAKHHMIDILDPGEDYSVGRYVEEADRVVQDILSRGKTAIIVGGTGLYVDALIAGREFAPYPETGRREELEAKADREGMAAMLEFLRSFDPDAAARLHEADRKRIIRACEVYLETGKTITQHNEETKKIPPRYNPLWLGLDYVNRQDLYDRIDLRVGLMLEQGLLNEIRALMQSGANLETTALQAIGYKEFLPALRGEISVEEAADQVRQASRRYAKRQLTWFRRNEAIHWIRLEKDPDFSLVLAEARQLLTDFDTADLVE